jgi:hypothetical protein
MGNAARVDRWPSDLKATTAESIQGSMRPSPDPLSTSAAPPRVIVSRPLLLVTALTLLVVGAGAVVAATAYVGKVGQESAPASSAPSAGCLLIHSRYGYPDRYLTRRVEYTKHPPLPVSGWRGPDENVQFAMLFHSLFHGYVVVEYRTDLTARTLAMLRSWVEGHAAQKVTSAPATAGAPFAVDVARWGYELRCTRERPLTTRALDRFLALKPPS